MPLVSIVIPAYNAAETLVETLASAAAQTHRKIEIIVVDDGSTDATATIAASFCERDPRARLVRQENRGVCAARNKGIAESEGEFVAPLDADDIWHPEKITRQVAAAGSQAGFVYSWSRDIDMADNVWRDGPRPQHEGSIFLRMLRENFVGNGSALLVRRSAALAVGGYDETMRGNCGEGAEDILFQLKLAEQFPAAVAPGYLIGYRRRASSQSVNLDAMYRSWLGARARLNIESPAARRVDRWGMSRRRLLLAEGMARRGRWSPAAGLLLAALVGDPYRSILALRRLALQKRTPRPMVTTAVRFENLAVEALWPGSREFDDPLRRLETQRDLALANLERRLSH